MAMVFGGCTRIDVGRLRSLDRRLQVEMIAGDPAGIVAWFAAPANIRALIIDAA
jgi:hypothetical protein